MRRKIQSLAVALFLALQSDSGWPEWDSAAKTHVMAGPTQEQDDADLDADEKALKAKSRKHSADLLQDLTWCETISVHFEWSKLLQLQRACEWTDDEMLMYIAIFFGIDAVRYVAWQRFCCRWRILGGCGWCQAGTEDGCPH